MYNKYQILKLQPSQIFINQGKIATLTRKIEQDGSEALQPIPVKRFNGIDRPVITDGHTRAYVLYSNGIETIETEWEDYQMDWMIYRLCVFWAQQRGITSVDQLELLHQFEYPRKWIGACHRAEKVLDDLFPDRTSDDIIDHTRYPELRYDTIVKDQTMY